MLALPGHGFVMLSLPKCASTSLVRDASGGTRDFGLALRGFCFRADDHRRAASAVA